VLRHDFAFRGALLACQVLLGQRFVIKIRYPLRLVSLQHAPVSEPHSSNPGRYSRQSHHDKRTMLQKLVEFIRPGPDSKDELIETLAEAEDNDIIGAQSRAMLEGVIRMSDMTASDVMVPATRLDLLNIEDPFDTLLHAVIDSGHSRFPVFEGTKANIIGILLAKDLLKRQRAPELNLRTLLRPPVFIPESKGLNDLLREFRGNRNHLAIVIDEFGHTAGLITIEDVLEEIVGEIEDEFDLEEDDGDIFALADKTYRVSGDTTIERIDEAFGTALATLDVAAQFDTIGGLIAHEMGHVPKRGEQWTFGKAIHRAGDEMADATHVHKGDQLQFTVQHSKGGVVKWFKVAVLVCDQP
jgi:magnesium and cobalt transporter